MKNELRPGTQRLGWLIDGDENTPPVSVLLADDGEEITLTIPWADRSAPYRYWFSFDMKYGDDPERQRRSYAPPEILWFRDVRGDVALVDCRARRASLGYLGEGVCWVAFAVLEGIPLADYRSINGLRSELPGLSDWMDLRSMQEEFETDDEGRLQALKLDVRAPDPVAISRSLNMCIRPSFSFLLASKADTSTINERLLIETRTKTARPWIDHIRAHNSLRDLVNLAGWERFGYANQWAIRDDDPHTTLSGHAVGEKWAEVRTYISPGNETTSESTPWFLFRYSDVGTSGIRRWGKLRNQYMRGLRPILTLLDQKPMPSFTTLTQLGIGLDGIGYQLALDSGLSPKAANFETHRARLMRIGNSLKVKPPFDMDEWADRSANAYNGVKHANRDMPDPSETSTVLGQNRLIARLWVATRVGVAPKRLEQSMAFDPAGRSQ